MNGQSCLTCGCTDERACLGGCCWLNVEETVCTACFISFFRRLVRAWRKSDGAMPIRAADLLAEYCIADSEINRDRLVKQANELAKANGVALLWLQDVKPKEATHRRCG